MNLSNRKSNGTYHHAVFVPQEIWEQINAEKLNADLVLAEHEVNVGDSLSFFKLDAKGNFTGDTTKVFYVKYADFHWVLKMLKSKYKLITW